MSAQLSTPRASSDISETLGRSARSLYQVEVLLGQLSVTLRRRLTMTSEELACNKLVRKAKSEVDDVQYEWHYLHSLALLLWTINIEFRMKQTLKSMNGFQQRGLLYSDPILPETA
eukprot:scpid63996/ scgid21477/ 